MEDMENIIHLTDADGRNCEFEFLDMIDYRDEEYVVLLPVDKGDHSMEDETGEVVILKVEQTDSEDTESYVSVDDEDEAQAVFEIFRNKFKNEFRFVDD